MTFKEDCPDLLNSKVIDAIRELQGFGCDVSVHDPIADPQDALDEYGLVLEAWDTLPTFNAAVLAVAHSAYLNLNWSIEMPRLIGVRFVVVDVKAVLGRDLVSTGSQIVWRP